MRVLRPDHRSIWHVLAGIAIALFVSFIGLDPWIGFVWAIVLGYMRELEQEPNGDAMDWGFTIVGGLIGALLGVWLL